MAGTPLLGKVSQRQLTTQEALSLAVRGRQEDGDSRWALPFAMAQWIDGHYSEALASLLEPSVQQASDSLLGIPQPCWHGRPQAWWRNRSCGESL